MNTFNALFDQCVEFRWAQHETWASFTKQQLVDMIVSIMCALHFTEEETKNTHIIFGDNEVAHMEGASSILNIASCIVRYDNCNDVTDCVTKAWVIVNRSMETYIQSVATPRFISQEQEERYTSAGVLDSQIKSKLLYCRLKTPEEFIQYSLMEELHHARMYWKYKTKQGIEYWLAQYTHKLRCRGIIRGDLYAVDALEIYASRAGMLWLAWHYAQHISLRTFYFLYLYFVSHLKKTNIVPSFDPFIVSRIFG